MKGYCCEEKLGACLRVKRSTGQRVEGIWRVCPIASRPHICFTHPKILHLLKPAQPFKLSYYFPTVEFIPFVSKL